MNLELSHDAISVSCDIFFSHLIPPLVVTSRDGICNMKNRTTRKRNKKNNQFVTKMDVMSAEIKTLIADVKTAR